MEVIKTLDTDEIKPYYVVKIKWMYMDCDEVKTKKIIIMEDEINDKELVDFLVCAYVCHYSCPATNACLEGFSHVKEAYKYFEDIYDPNDYCSDSEEIEYKLNKFS